MTGAEWEVIALSARVAALSVLVAFPPALAVAWLLARRRGRWLVALHGLVMLPLVLPPVVTGYLLLRVFGRSGPLGGLWTSLTGGQLAFSTAGCVIAAAVVGFPLIVESVRLALLAVPRELEHVSRTLGRGRLATALRVTLPLAAPGLLAGLVLGFARALGEFGATIVLAGNIAGETRTIPVAVYTLLQRPGGEAAAARLVVISVLVASAALLASSALQRRSAP